MANPRRATSSLPTSAASPPPPLPSSAPTPALTSVAAFLRRPHAFPFLLSAFVLLTWISLRFQNRHGPLMPSRGVARSAADGDANLVRFSSLEFPSRFFRDKRGWFVNPIDATRNAGVTGGAQYCLSVHVGEIRSGGIRGNHRHHTCNETFVIWGAETKYRVENTNVERGYTEVVIGADEVAIATSPIGTAHALINVDAMRTTFFLGCQDCIVNYTNSGTDFNIWKDL